MGLEGTATAKESNQKVRAFELLYRPPVTVPWGQPVPLY